MSRVKWDVAVDVNRKVALQIRKDPEFILSMREERCQPTLLRVEKRVSDFCGSESLLLFALTCFYLLSASLRSLSSSLA